MQKSLTPNWQEICSVLIFTLDELADEVDFSLERKEDPMPVVLNVIDELKLFIDAVENDPGQFSTRDAS